MKKTTRSLFTVDVVAKTISASKATLIRAMNPNSAEYVELNLLRADNPNFEVVQKQPKKRKETYDGMNFDFMRNYIQTQADAEEVLVEFECVKLVNNNRYAPVKKWFLDAYKDDEGKFDMVKAKAEITEYRIKLGQDMAKNHLNKQMEEMAKKLTVVLPGVEPTVSEHMEADEQVA